MTSIMYGTFSQDLHFISGLTGPGTLTVTVRARSRLPKSSKMLITAEMSTIAKNKEETPPEIQRQIFWCNKNFPKNFSAEISPEMNRKLTGNDIF